MVDTETFKEIMVGDSRRNSGLIILMVICGDKYEGENAIDDESQLQVGRQHLVSQKIICFKLSKVVLFEGQGNRRC